MTSPTDLSSTVAVGIVATEKNTFFGARNKGVKDLLQRLEMIHEAVGDEGYSHQPRQPNRSLRRSTGCKRDQRDPWSVDLPHVRSQTNEEA
jgi:hypothetical protein